MIFVKLVISVTTAIACSRRCSVWTSNSVLQALVRSVTFSCYVTDLLCSFQAEMGSVMEWLL